MLGLNELISPVRVLSPPLLFWFLRWTLKVFLSRAVPLSLILESRRCRGKNTKSTLTLMTQDDHLWLQNPYSIYHVDKYNQLRGQTTSLPGTAGACSISIFKTWPESLSKDIGRWEPIAEGDPSTLISSQSWSKLSSPEIYYYLLQVYYRTYEPWFPLTVKENPVKVCSSAFRGNEWLL